MSLFIEDRDEFVADDLALFFGIAYSGELGEKSLRRIHSNDVQAKFAAQVLLHFLKFILAQHPVVHEDAGQAIAQRAMHQLRRHRGIHAAT